MYVIQNSICFFFLLFSDHNLQTNVLPFCLKDPKDGPLELHGIFFHYDLSALKVIVTLDREDLITFVVRLCSVIAGIIVLSGKAFGVWELTFRF